MNGLSISGMKISTPAPAKKTQSRANKQTATSTPIKNSNYQKSNIRTVKKQDPKKQLGLKQKPKVEEKSKQSALKQTKLQQPVKIQSEKVQIPAPIQYEVLVRYNHYKENFNSVNSILDFTLVDDKYAFSYVFKGNFVPVLKMFQTKEVVECIEGEYKNEDGETKRGFKWKVQEGMVYGLEIREDEVEEAKRERKVYMAPVQEKKCPCKKNNQVDLLTKEMRNMGIDQLGSSDHKEMLEQRDLEEILFSGNTLM